MFMLSGHLQWPAQAKPRLIEQHRGYLVPPPFLLGNLIPQPSRKAAEKICRFWVLQLSSYAHWIGLFSLIPKVPNFLLSANYYQSYWLFSIDFSARKSSGKVQSGRMDGRLQPNVNTGHGRPWTVREAPSAGDARNFRNPHEWGNWKREKHKLHWSIMVTCRRWTNGWRELFGGWIAIRRG